MLIHREALNLANNAADENSDRYCIKFVQITKDGHVVATDGHHFLRIKALVDEPSLLDALMPEDKRDNAVDALVPADTLQSFAAAVKKVDANAHVVIAAENGTITLATADGVTERTFVTKPPDLPFPDVAKVTRETSEKTLTLGVELMMRLLRTLKACGASSVTLGVNDAESPITVAAFCDSGPIDGAIMPMLE